MLRQHQGWWFDTDVIWLRGEAEFGRFQQPIVAGNESDGFVNGAVLKFNDSSLPGDLKACAEEIARSGRDVFRWGAVGPALITHFLSRHSMLHQVMSAEAFCPIHWKCADWALDPERLEEAIALCRNAHCYHIWNEVLRDLRIPKNLMPPAGSFLHQRFVAVAPELAGLPTLPVETLRALVAHAGPPPDMGFMHHLRQLVPSAVNALRKRRTARE